MSLLFGAVTVVTAPTVIVPMLRTVRPTARIANILRVIDPIGALLAVLVFEFIISGRTSSALGHTLLTFGNILALGLIIGAAAGYALGTALRKHWLPEYLHNVATLTLVFGVFAISNTLQDESGLLTVTVMGIWLANMRGVSIVAAAVAALFALRLQEQGYPGAGLLVPLTFMVIIGTVVLQSATSCLIAIALGVAESEPRGFLIVGAHPIARAIAQALKKRGYHSLLCDNN